MELPLGSPRISINFGIMTKVTFENGILNGENQLYLFFFIYIKQFRDRVTDNAQNKPQDLKG